MNKQITFRHRGIELIWFGGLTIFKSDSLMPLKLSYNKTAGWWISHNIFFSVQQLKNRIKKNYVIQGHRKVH